MLVRDKNSQESYIHVCDGITEKQMRKKALEIRIHDVTTFIVTNGVLEHVKHCPYCGVNLSEEVVD